MTVAAQKRCREAPAELDTLIVQKFMPKLIARRTLLRGAGVALSLPWLESLATAGPTSDALKLSEPPLRMAFMFMPNGVRPEYWTPAGDGEDYEITPHLKPLENLKNDFMLLENPVESEFGGAQRALAQSADLAFGRIRPAHHGGRPGYRRRLGGPVGRTTDRRPDAAADHRTGHGHAAQRHRRRWGRLRPHVRLVHLLARSAHAGAQGDRSATGVRPPVPHNRAPVVSSVNPKDPSLLTVAAARRHQRARPGARRRRSLRGNGSAADRVRLDEYFESVRSVEQRLEATLRPQKRWINQGKFPLERPGPGDSRIRTPEHVRLMLDIFILAFWTDTTRIGTFMFGDAQSGQDYSFLPGVKGSFHSLFASRRTTPIRDQYGKIIDWHIGADGLLPTSEEPR